MDTKFIKVLIADDNMDQCKQVKSIIDTQDDMEVIEVAYNGIDTYNKILKYDPDVAIIDFIMPELDGLGILEKLYSNISTKVSTKSIILSPLQKEEIAKRANDLGASYYMLKPYDINSLLKRIRDLALTSANKSISNHLEFNNNLISLQYKITKVILELGVPANIRGYHYIRDAIIFCINDFELLNYVTKELYPSIAKKYNTTPYKVERAMRHAIEVAWTRGDKDTIDKMFAHTVNKNRGKPTNSEFIALIVDKFKLENSRYIEMY